MKPLAHKQITISQVAAALDAHTLAAARALLADSIGAQITLSGIVLKVIKRGTLKIVLKADSPSRPLEAIADFSHDTEKQKVADAKIRKGSSVTLTGKLQSFGSAAVTISECKLQVS